MSSDAPGWGQSAGPICWRCRGQGSRAGRSNAKETCTVCLGVGRLPTKVLKRARESTSTTVTRNWKDDLVPGPLCANERVDVDATSECITSFVGGWKIVQNHRGGHRWSTDDLLTSWVAAVEVDKMAEVKTHLDLGCGIGSVLMMTHWYLYDRNARGFGIEAQSRSFSQATRSLVLNGVADRVKVVNRDFRDAFETELEKYSFDLVTGTPPYFPVEFDADTGTAKPGMGGMPTNMQSAPARYEFRGGIEEYVRTANMALAKTADAVAVICEGNLAARPNGCKRADRAGKATDSLRLVRTVFVHGREDKVPLFAVHVFKRSEFFPKDSPKQSQVSQISVRHVGGKRTAEYNKACMKMGIPPYDDVDAELGASLVKADLDAHAARAHAANANAAAGRDE